jgi:hypothetical protein
MTAKTALSGGRRAVRTVRHPLELHRGDSKPSGGRMRKKLAAIRGMPVSGRQGRDVKCPS